MIRARETLIVFISIFIFILFSINISTAEFALSQAPIYKIVQLDDPETQLQDDAAALKLNLSEAALEKDHIGWWIYSTNDFEIRRLKGSGYFTYISKKNYWPKYDKGSEPVSEDTLESRARTYLESLGISEDQMSYVSVNRIVDQLEDINGNDVGPRQTVGFIVYVKREINGISIDDSNAKVVFNSDGVLHKITTSWRKIDTIPVAVENVIEESILLPTCRSIVEGIAEGREIKTFKTYYAYVEGPHKKKQDNFSLKYVFVYSFGSFVYKDGIDATEK